MEAFIKDKDIYNIYLFYVILKKDKMKIQDSNFNYLKVDFYSVTIRNILNCCAVEMYMPALILTLCCIDYIGIPLSGNKTNTRGTFKQFLNDYMSIANPKYKDSNIQEAIYAIRCSLVHTFGEADSLKKINLLPSFEVGNMSYKKHLNIFFDEEKKTNCILISIFDFISETIGGIEYFFRNIKDNNILIEWYKNLYVMNGVSDAFNKISCVSDNKIIYTQIHPLLYYMDENVNCDITDLTKSINKKLLHYYNNPEDAIKKHN